jgi:hypothetical protein
MEKQNTDSSGNDEQWGSRVSINSVQPCKSWCYGTEAFGACFHFAC